MIQAHTVRYLGSTRREANRRCTLHFSADAVDFPIHAVYHDPPDLSPEAWALCIEEVALACLVDVSTATMTTGVQIDTFHPGRTGLDLLGAATTALRQEVLYSWSHSLSRLPMDVRARGPRAARPRLAPTDPERVMLLMGGGKDSLYCLRLLQAAGYEVECFYVTEARRTWHQLRRVYAALEPEVVQHRTFLDVGRRGTLTEAFGRWYQSQYQIGQVVAMALPYALSRRCGSLALGLERTSDLPMATYRGVSVNHQHQKSTEHIQALNRHLADRFGGRLRVISPLKGLYDMGIYARFLDRARDLVDLQSSCGGANTHRPHCGRCAKCGFLAALLAGLSGDRELYDRLFPSDPLRSRAPYEAWLDSSDTRPLTCAGTKSEVRLGLDLARLRGWPMDWYARGGSAPQTNRWIRDLDRFVRSYPNPLVPSDMAARLEPVLDYDPSGLVMSVV